VWVLMGLRGIFSGLVKTKNQGICSHTEFTRLVEKERCRVDRNDHHYSLLVFNLNLEEVTENQFQKFIQKIRQRLRNIDEIGWYAEKKLGIILPYTTKTGAEKLAGEICGMIEPPSGCTACEVYSYSSQE
jgi:hypothetical protein